MDRGEESDAGLAPLLLLLMLLLLVKDSGEVAGSSLRLMMAEIPAIIGVLGGDKAFWRASAFFRRRSRFLQVYLPTCHWSKC